MKSYLTDSLGEGERVEFSAKVTHWIMYYLIIESLVILTGLHFISKIELLNTGITLPIFAGGIKVSLLLVLFIVLVIKIIMKSISTLIYVYTTEIAITNKRVIYKTGLISRETLETRVQRIEGANITQGIIARVLGYGDVLVTGTGTNLLYIRHIDDPIAFRRALLSTAPNTTT